MFLCVTQEVNLPLDISRASVTNRIRFESNLKKPIVFYNYIYFSVTYIAAHGRLRHTPCAAMVLFTAPLLKQWYCNRITRLCMSKAFLFLHTLEDAEYAVRALGLPIELVPEAPIKMEERIQVTRREELENAYRRLCSNNSTGEFTALRV